MDYVGAIDGENFAGGEGRDQLVELGSGRLVPGFEDQLLGAKAGDERTVTVSFPDDYGAAELAARRPSSRSRSRRSSARTCPSSTTTSPPTPPASTASPSCAEDIMAKLREADESRVEAEFREAVLDAVVKDSQVEVPSSLVDARAQELWERMLHSLSHQGITKEAYLRIAGREEEEILEEAKPDAERALRREAVIAAVVAAEGIEATEGRRPRRPADDRRARADHAREAAGQPREGRPPGRPA
jgi:trigger factor